jgi:DNA topoisomerase-3
LEDRLLNGGFRQPRDGRNNDKAHPPIHPVNYVDPSVLNAQEKAVYEFVTRRFLACCSEDAKGELTQVEIEYGIETFKASGLIVLQRNYLDVYPYDKWESSQQLPSYQIGETFVPHEAKMTEGKTSAPGYLTEPELIALMDANGIGTDATMAEHINKIKEREYVSARARGGRQGPTARNQDDDAQATRGRGGGRGRGRGRGRGGGGAPDSRNSTQGVEEFVPTTLGIALIEGYENLQFETSLSKPFLRKQVRLFSSSRPGNPMVGSMTFIHSVLTTYVGNWADGASDESHLRGQLDPKRRCASEPRAVPSCLYAHKGTALRSESRKWSDCVHPAPNEILTHC